jgi:holo-[acyl-carrier protein] synthase
MAILGLGIDIVELERIGRLHRLHGQRFIDRFCVPGEVQAREDQALIEHLGGIFAAKEALLKALGTGWAQGLGFLQLEIVRRPGGAPAVRYNGRAKERAEELGVHRTHLTITHERAYAVAFAILEGDLSTD